jgi:hypothetical protein
MGAITGLLGSTLAGPNWLYRGLAYLALGIGVLTYGYVKGISHEQSKQALEHNQQLIKSAALVQQQIAVNHGAAARLQASYEALGNNYLKLQKEVKKHVTISDSTCNLSNGWLLLHDSAANATVPGASAKSEADPSGTSAVEALTDAIIPNYQEYVKCRQQVIEFVGWYDKNRALYETAK